MLIRKIAGLHTNRNDLQILQRDPLIDAGTVGLFDFGDGFGFPPLASPAPGSYSLPNYVRGGLPATNGPADKTWSLASGIAIPGGSKSEHIDLPASWQMPASATHFGIGFFAKVSTANITNASNAQIIGCRSASGVQYTLYLNYSASAYTGVASMQINGTTVNMSGIFPTDGLMHHYAIEPEVLTSTTMRVRFYIDGVLVFTSGNISYAGTLIQPGVNPAFGYYYNSASSVVAAAMSVARAWLQDLTVAGSKTMAQMIAQDRTANAARFS